MMIEISMSIYLKMNVIQNDMQIFINSTIKICSGNSHAERVK